MVSYISDSYNSLVVTFTGSKCGFAREFPETGTHSMGSTSHAEPDT